MIGLAKQNSELLDFNKKLDIVVSELNVIKKEREDKQLETLLKEGWISIDQLKKSPANHKAFLTREEKRIFLISQRLLVTVFELAISPS